MKTASPNLNEWIAEGLAFDTDFNFSHAELVPRWAVAYLRKVIFEKNMETILQSENEVAVYIDTVLCEDSKFVKTLRELNEGRFYSAVFRNDVLHIFKDEEIRERNGDVMIKGESLETFMSHLIHADWRCEIVDWMTEECPINQLANMLKFQENGEFAFLFQVERLNKLPIDVRMTCYGD